VVDTRSPGKKQLQPATGNTEKIHDALVLGIRDYFQKSGFSQATLGLSGGIDSAVTAVLAVRALGAENVRVLLLPSRYSSDHSLDDARKLAENLRIRYDIIPIQNAVEEFEKGLAPLFEGTSPGVTEENIQNGGLAVLGDVYKMDVYRLARFMNRDREIIPENSITKPPSAELRPNQKDSDSLPEYDELDQILFQFIEMNKSPKEIMEMGFREDVVNRVIRLVNMNEYKRFQAAPILRISSKAFGFGRKMPLVAKY
jgi:NAD+ synthase (glutamine-hydrolysing)